MRRKENFATRIDASFSSSLELREKEDKDGKQEEKGHIVTCHEYFCFFCDTPADEHRNGSCRKCGRPLTQLQGKPRPVFLDIQRHLLSLGDTNKRYCSSS